MRTFSISLLVLIAVIGLADLGTTYAQDVVTTSPTLPTADTGAVPIDPTLPPAEPAPLPPQPAPPAPEPAPWTWQHQTQNQQGTVTNLHERTRAQDGNAYSYQHSVTRPSGSQTQLREYSQTDQGYQLMRQQRFYKPDGTLLREHGMSVTGTDPYNYQRQMTHTFRDGRTMDKTFTRSYDGTTGTMGRSFVGPNGQVRQFERPWTPDSLVDTETPILGPVDASTPTAQEASLAATEQLGAASPTIVDPLAPTTTKADEGFLSRLNPFKKRESKRMTGSSATAKRSGFTIGSFGRSRRMDTLSPGQARKASGLSNSSQVRSRKTNMKRIGTPAHATASLPSTAGKKH